jgi:pimeloyl-ACP methyl ester carboxylesterase
MPHALAGDLRVYYEEHRRAGGPPLVLLHGFTSTSTTWQPHLDAFGARYRLLVPDLRGHGHTANPGGLAAMTHRQFGRDIIAFCRALGVERAAFCGHSSGAMLLLTLAVEAPDLAVALVLASGTHYYGAQVRARWATLSPDSVFQVFRDPAAARAWHAPLGEDGWRAVASAFLALGSHAHTDDFPEQARLRGLAAPTLILHGDRDHSFPVAVPVALHGLLPDAELCILPHTGHGLPNERPEWFRAIALDFLQRRANAERTAK